MPHITKEELLKINICVAHARSRDQDKPGTYSRELNRTLQANNLPTIIIPEDHEDNTHEQTQGATGETTQPEPYTPVSSRQSNISEQPTSLDSVPSKKIDASELGLVFFATSEEGWPQNFFTTDDLIKGVRSNKYKWKYSNNKLSEEQVLRKVQGGEIKLNKCWFAIATDEFRKIRSGLEQERSPLESRDPLYIIIILKSYNIMS